MITTTLPICQLCGKEVEHSLSTVKDIFTPTGRQEVLFSVTLSCGCVIDYPDFIAGVKDGTQSIKDRWTGQVILTYFDSEMYDDDEDDE